MKLTLMKHAKVALLCAFLCIAPARAADLVVAGQDGTNDPPNPTEGATTEEDWNPVVDCTVPPGGTIDDLLTCLLDNIANPPACTYPETATPPGDDQWLASTLGDDYCNDPRARQDFTVTLLAPPEYGVKIRRLDGSEIDRIALRENDPGIQTTELRNDLPDRVARVGLIAQTPQGGTVYVVINDVTVSCATALSGGTLSLAEVNASLLHQLIAAGLTVSFDNPYIFVRDLRAGSDGVHRVQFRSTDPGIISSDLGLYPDDDPLVPPSN